MVATHISHVQNTSPSAPRKNRRKISRKVPRNTNADEPVISEDEEMNDASSSKLHAVAKSAVSGAVHVEDDEDLMIDADLVPPTQVPAFPPVAPGTDRTVLKSETRRIPIPPHRMTPLKKDWVNIFGPLTEILGLQVRMNVQRRCVEARVSNITFYSQSTHQLWSL